jgi:hypothetical protein
MATNAGAVTEAIRGAALCTICIARKTGAAPLGVLSALARIEQGVRITEGVTWCDDCLQQTVVYQIGWPDDETAAGV